MPRSIVASGLVVLLCVAACCVALVRTERVMAAEPSGVPKAPQSAPAPQASTRPADDIVLGGGSFWRWYAMSRPAVYVQAAGDNANERKRVFGNGVLTPAEASTLTPGPPANWHQPDFDDGDWPRSPGKSLAVEACGHGKESEQLWVPRPMGWGAGAVLVRGRFNVRDPQKVRNMTFSLTVTGGAMVYVNGRRLAAVGMPDGEIALSTPATPYEPDAYQDVNKQPIPDAHMDLAGLIKRKRLDAGAVDRAEARKRWLTRVPVPADLLRAGVNVVAIELHRSDFHETAKLWRARGGYGFIWSHTCFWDACLAADANGAVEPNVQRPPGFQVWNLDRNAYVTDFDYGDPTEPLRPIVLVGARNGTFSGRVVASSRTAIKGLKADLSELASANGKDSIPAGQVAVRYSDELEDAPPNEVAAKNENGAVCSVWLSVRVPKDALPGTYKGVLTVKADGETAVKAPVELSVAEWALPDPLAFKTNVGVYQSLSSVAIKYKVPMWSEEHWKLLDKSFALLTGLGCKFASISVVDQGMMGDEEGAVIWRKKPDGTYDYDYSILERYLKLVKSRLGKCPYIVLGIWQVPDSGYTIIDTKLAPGTTVTVLDPATGKKEHLAVPPFGTKESDAFWKPVMLGIQDVFKRCDLESSMCLGYCHDGDVLPKPVGKMFDDILGRTRWFRSGHPPDYNLEPRKVSDKGTMDYHEVVYTRVQTRLPPIAKLLRSPNLLYVRSATPWDLMVWRTTPEWAIWNGQSGFGHIGLDFWPMDRAELQQSKVRYDERFRSACLYGRWPRDNGWPGPLCPPALTRPGKDGACPTLAYESLREGLQEFEAAVSVLDAAESQSAKIGDELTRRGKALFAERRAVIERGMRFKSPPSNAPDFCGWQDLSRRTLQLAGEIDKALKK